jgi:predicted enzyme related to lactoylglutathione lyase/membrane protease YdiL (CAAX protease family)
MTGSFSRLLVAGVASECALLALAFAIGWFAGVPPFERLRLDFGAVGYGIAAAVPLLGVLRWCLRTEWGPVRRLVTLVEEQLTPYLAGASAGGIVLLSLMAGIGEETLFRGVLQTGLAGWLPVWAAVGIAALLFGVAHWLTMSYAVLAGLIGGYLGVVFLVTDNLLVPAVAHALYDVVALSVLAGLKPPHQRLDPPHQEIPMTVTQAHAPGTFCWAELLTTDAQAAKRFYTGLFGWSFQDVPIGENAYYTMFEIGGKSISALHQMGADQAAQSIPPNWLSYVSVDSADRAVARARELGATVVMEPFDVFDSGRMGVIQDPTGAVVGLWEPKNHIGAEIVGEPNTMCWNELNTSDIDRAAGFYAGLFGWEPQKQPMGDFTYTYFKHGERMSGGMMQISPEFWMVYFAVDDCDAKAALAEKLGGKIFAPPTDVPEVGRFAIVQDPQGAAFAIIRLLPAQ